jgi:hypothetical protein
MQTMNCQSVRFALPQWAVLLVLAVAAALFSCSAGAQSSSSAVNGVVSDPNQAVVAGAKVTLKNTETNVERDTVSNGSGNYFFTNVPPARYTVSFVMQGFQTQRIAAFDLGVAQAITINASLKVGAVSESVTVEATGAQVDRAAWYDDRPEAGE